MAVKYLNKPVFLSTLICIFLFYSGIIKIPERYKFFSLLNKNEINEIRGTILSSPVKNQNGKYYSSYIDVFESQDLKGNYSSAYGRLLIYIPSEMVEAYFPGKLYSSADKGAYLYDAGGIYTFSGKISDRGFYVTNCSNYYWPQNITGKIDRYRALCRLQFKRLMYSWGKGGGLLLALLCGAKEYTETSISEAFKNAGLSHVLALSGMHLSMFSSIAMFFGKKIKRKKISFIIRIIALVIFVWFAGLSPSLLRAFICAMLTILASISGANNPDLLMILCFSFSLQCIISPSDIMNTGFILSYGALAGILMSSRFFNQIYSKLFPQKISSSLASSTGAQLITAPVSLKFFGTFSPIGIIATTVISPFITIFIYSGLFLIFASLIFPAFQKPSGIFVNFLYTIINYIVTFFSQAPKWSLN